MEPNDDIKKIAGGIGCDIVTGTSEFEGRNGKRIYAIISNEDDSRIVSFRDDKIILGLSYFSIKRVDTVTLTGTGGECTIICNGITKTCTWNAGGLTATATAFVSANAAAYLASGVVLTSLGAVLIFIAVVAGTDFTGSTTGANASGDLLGTAATTVLNKVFACNNNRLIIPDNPLISITPGKGSFCVYYING